MNEDEMRGCFRASEVILALESSFSGDELLAKLNTEANHAMAVAQKSSDIGTRDEWYWRGKMYLAAYRRHTEEEALRAA